MPTKLTNSFIRELQPPERGQNKIYDQEIRGFGIRVMAAGTKSFIFHYRIKGRERTYTIGQYPAWTLTNARARAKELRRAVDLGDDPMRSRSEDRGAATVNDLWKMYQRDHLPKKRDAKRDKELWTGYLKPYLGKIKVKDVSRSDIYAMHVKITQSGKPVRANRVLALASKMFSMSVDDYEIRSENPVSGIKRNDEEARKRYLSTSELQRLTSALESHSSQTAANAIRMMLLTGARKGEVLSMSWQQIDLERGNWVKPSAHTKTKKEHSVPLSVPAIDLLKGIRACQNEHTNYVFPSNRTKGSISDISNSWMSIRKRANLNDVTLHDLRHTYASILANDGVPLGVIGALLGHTQWVTTQRYAHIVEGTQRHATEIAGKLFTGVQTRKGDDKDEAPTDCQNADSQG